MEDNNPLGIGIGIGGNAEPGSVYDSYRKIRALGADPTSYGNHSWSIADRPDIDPIGISSDALAATGASPVSSDTVTGLRLANGVWKNRDELVQTEQGRRLVEAEERTRRGQKMNIIDGLFRGSWTDLVPFLGMAASVGGDPTGGIAASNAFRKMTRGEDVTDDEAIAATLFTTENRLRTDGTWGYTFGSIIRQAPAFFAEFGLLGKAGQAVRSAAVRGIVSKATDEAAKSASKWALTRSVKTGIDEYAETLVRQFADRTVAETGKTFAEAVAELGANSTLKSQTLESLSKLSKQLVEGAANATARPSDWAPGLASKVADIRSAEALEATITRLSSDNSFAKAWRGLRRATANSFSEGLIDLGNWGSDAATTITTGQASAGKAALDAMLGLTVGAAARGSALFLPKAAVSETIGRAAGFVGQNELALEQAAFYNKDPELLDKAWRMGMFMDLMEYVSESTGRGFNGAARAIGLAVAPKLMAPTRKVAGLLHPVKANITRDAAGAATGVTYEGLFEMGRQAEVGGAIRRYLDRSFGGVALKESVSSDRYRAVVRALGEKGVAIDNPAALQATLDSGVYQAGVSDAIRSAMGDNVRRFATSAVKAANRAGAEGRKIHGTMLYYVADYLARHNIDAVAAGDKFRQMGYDGVVSEMFEERYSDVVNAIFGMNAHKDQSWRSKMTRAWRAAFGRDEDTGEWRLGDLLAEAAAFSVPLVARASIMRGIAAMGGPNEFRRHKDWASLYHEGTRYASVGQYQRGDYLRNTNAQIERLNAEAAGFREQYEAEISERGAPVDEGQSPRVPRTEAEMRDLLDSEARYRKAAARLTNLRDSFLASVVPSGREVADTDVVTAPMYEDAYLLSSDEEYNLRLHPTEGQLRKSMGAYGTLVDGAAQEFQTLYKMDTRTQDEDAGWFRKAARRIAESTLRLTGAAVTGDMSFLSVNPARWVNNDRSVPDDISDAGMKLYANVFEPELRRIQSERAKAAAEGRDIERPELSDYDAAHEAALEKVKPHAAALMAKLLASHQTRMFSENEIQDIALGETAREDGYVASADGRREFVSISDGTRVSFDDYAAREGVADRAAETAKTVSTDLYMALTRGLGTDRVLEVSRDTGTRSVEDILSIPSDLPTKRQALLEKVIRTMPQFRGISIAREAQDKPVDSQLGGIATDQRLVDAISTRILPNGLSTADGQFDIDAIASKVSEVDDAVLARFCLDLNIPLYSLAKTADGQPWEKQRNRLIAEIVASMQVSRDDGLRLFSRTSSAEETDNRLGSPYGVFAPARFTGSEWVARADGRDFRAATVDALAAQLAEAGYSQVQPKMIFTSARVLQSSDPLTMIRALNLGRIYRERLENSGVENAQLDPLLRRTEAGFEFANEDDAFKKRTSERVLAELYESKGKQDDPALYILPGESASNPDHLAKAAKLFKAAKDAWDARNARSEDGKALGYVAVADDLLREYGVSTPFSSRGNAFGTASQSLRGKYSINVRSLQSVGATGNVYIPINHGDAQNYQSAVLDAALLTAYARNGAYIRQVFPDLISAFVDDLDREASVIQAQNAGKDDRLAEDIQEFRRFATQRTAGQYRIPSPTAFAAMVSAFNLYRTEVDNTHLQSVLGPHAAALKALAPVARKLTSFIGFTGAVDRILGGAGFETSLLTGKEAPASGLARYWAVFAPSKVGTMSDAIANAKPDNIRDFNEFVTRVTGDAAASGKRPAPTPGRATSMLEAVQAAVVANDLDVSEVQDFLDDAVGEVRASELGGDAGPIAPSEITPETIGGIRVATEEDDEEFSVTDEDDQWAMSAPAAVPAVAPAVTESHDIGELHPSEARALVKTFVAMSVVDTGSRPTLPAFKAMLQKLIPGLRSSDIRDFTNLFRDLKDDERIMTDLSWGADDIEDEEGGDTDGTEHTNQRSVDMLKRKALSDFLAMMNLVSPSTGRDFQPFVEDLRSLVRSQELLNPDATDDVKEAFQFLSRILNPRAQHSDEGAAGRDSLWRHRMETFETDKAAISRYVRAFLGDYRDPPVSGRAALLLSYLASIPRNARINLATLIGSSSPSSPVRLDRAPVGGSMVFQVSPVRRKGGHVSMDAITGSFARLAGLSKAELSDVVSGVESAFKESLKAGNLSVSRGLLTNYSQRRTGLLDEYARILGPVLGWDSPLVSMFVSQPMASMLGGEYLDAKSRGLHLRTTYYKLLAKFGSASDSELPSAAASLVGTLKALASDPKAFNERAVDLFQAGAPAERNVTRAATSLQGASVWSDLMRAYADAKPVSVMTAETDPERTSRPSSSLAITMCGIEPALQEFLDRKDENGFAAVIRKWFPKLASMSEEDFDARIDGYRQRMIWPTSRADLIVAKSVSKSALASETIKGCETSYALETMTDAEFANAYEKYGPSVAKFVRRNMVYVPVYSGDHASSILLQVPLAKEFKAAGLSYDDAAQMVASWVGLDLLGTDAKRSAVTCLEAPGTSMWDYRYDDKGEILRDGEEGNPVRGHAYVSIVWNSDPAANNEAMIGTTGMVGYGARRQQELAKDTKSNTIKCHIASVGEDAVYGPVLSLIKSLAVAMPAKESGYQFVEGSPMAFLQDHATKLIKGEEDISTVTYTDFDSIKLGVANSKTIFAGYDEKGDPVPLMQKVFGRLAEALDGKVTDKDGKPVEIGSTLTGTQLDELVGPIEWTNLGGSGKKGTFMLSEILNGARIREVRRDGDFGGRRMFSLDYVADNQMAFQVANVSHHAKTSYTRTPRNNMLDALAMAKNLGTYNAGADVFPAAKAVTGEVRELVASWGFNGAAIATQGVSIDKLLEDDEGYQDLLARDEPETGDLARDYRMRVFAANARKNLLNVPINCIQTPLTTNAGWIGKDGRGHSHSASKMFNDTLQGARTIARADRAFMRGAKYAAIANVNCTDASFRHGLYIDKEALLSAFSDVVKSVPTVSREQTGSYRQVVALLDHVVSTIVTAESSGDAKGPYHPSGEVMSWREKLANCLLDHHGRKFSLRSRSVRKAVRDAEGNRVVGEDGRPKTDTRTEYLWETVSFADLFTYANSGRREFDRTAVYPAMHLDADDSERMYLGGTLMGIPRTPSYNGSMWLQNARAGLPVTERVDGDSGQWECGNDAMISPDPFTLAILGCDHDGDKTTLYMLAPGGNASVKELSEGIEKLIADTGMAGKDFTYADAGTKALIDAHLARLSQLGYIEYAKEDGKVKDLRLTKRGRARISNAFVQGLFDMNRMLPVGTDEGGKSVYSGPVRDGEKNVGSMFGATKAAMGPKRKDGATYEAGMWDIAIKAVMGPKVLDAEKGAIIGKPRVAAEVQTGAAVAAEARAVIVSTASSLHFAYMSGLPVGPFSTRRGVTPQQWVDFMYHVDGLSNMTFDDIKEQICSRLGVKPNMIETIIADLLNGKEGDTLPTTDQEFLTAFAKYAVASRDERSSRYWMGRASDPADFDFRRDFGRFISSEGAKEAFESRISKWVELQRVKGDQQARFAEGWAEELSARFDRLTANTTKNPFAGAVYFISTVVSDSRAAEEIDGLVRWATTMDQLSEAKDFAQSVNYTGVDPAANNASARARDLRENFDRIIADMQVEGKIPADQADVRIVNMLRAGTALMYDASVGEVVAAKGFRAERDFRTNRAWALARYANSAAVPGRTSREALLTAALYAVPKLSSSDPMALQANAQSVGWSLAAFNTVRQIPGSAISSQNAYEVLDEIGRTYASIRHPKAPGTNVTLDVRYGIESMADLMGRFAVNSTMHAELPIFNYIREVPDAGAYGFSEDQYGPAARGLSRLIPSMSGVSEAQIAEMQGLYDRVVNGRELDSNGAVGGKAYESTTGFKPRYRLSLALNLENLAAMKKFVAAQTSKTKVDARSAAQGNARDVERTIEELEKVFTALEKRFGKGFTVQPSALFGQLLPLYAAFTNRVESAPEAGSSSLLSILGDTFSRWARELGSINADPRKEPYVSMGIAINWASVVAAEPEEDNPDALRVIGEGPQAKVKNLRSRRAAASGAFDAMDDLRRLAEEENYKEFSKRAYNAMNRGNVLAFDRKTGRPVKLDAKYDTFSWDEAKDPRFRHTLSIFDGARGVLYRQLLAATRGQLAETMRNPKSATARAQTTAPAVAPAAAPVSAPVPRTSVTTPKPIMAEGSDERVREMADRMGALLKMWDKGRVEYSGGNKFTIYGNLRLLDPNLIDGESYETRIDVEVSNGPLLSEAKLAEMVRSRGANFLKSLSNRTGVPVDALEKMEESKLLALLRAYAPAGLSHTDALKRRDGEFFLQGEIAGLLAGRIELAGNADEKTLYHELFHSVMGFMRQIDAFSEEDVKVLNKRFGDHGRLGSAWFDEEKAADEFRDFVIGELKPSEERDGVFARIRSFVMNLLDILFRWNEVRSEEYANPMRDNPLAGIVLTGRVHSSYDASVRLDLHGKMARATMTYLSRLDNLVQAYRAHEDIEDSAEAAAVGKMLANTPFDVIADGSDRTGFDSVSRMLDYIGQEPGYSVTSLKSDELAGATTNMLRASREGAMLQYFGFQDDEDIGVSSEAKAVLVRFGEFLNRLEEIGRKPEGTRKGDVDALVAEFNEPFVTDEESGAGRRNLGTMFKDAYVKFMRKYGPKQAEKAPTVEQTLKEEVVAPNQRFESSIADMIKGVEIVEGSPEDFDAEGYGLRGEDAYDVQAVAGEVRSRLRAAGIDRMARPYAKMQVIAREIGRAVKANLAYDPAAFNSITEAQAPVFSAEENAVVADALRHVASIYGTDLGGNEKVRNAVFRAAHEVRALVGPDAPETRMRFGGTDVNTAKYASAPVVAAAITTATGIRPADIVDTALEDIRAIESRYAPENTFRLNVISPIKAAFEVLASTDPSRLVDDSAYLDRKVWDAVDSIRDGLAKGSGSRQADGTYSDFALAPAGEGGRYAERNGLRYADHITNPDFHALLHTALDRLFLLGASMRFYRQLGFEPGNPEDVIGIRGNIAPANMPEPMTPAEAMTSLNAAPEQLADKDLDVVSHFDQPYFSANHPEAWLDSMTRPRFGNVNLRDSQQNGARNIAGFRHRANMLNNLQTRLLGLDIQPGQAITAIDRSYRTKMEMEGGQTVRRGGKTALKFKAYDGAKAISRRDGKPVVFSLADVRRADMFAKAVKVWASGGTRMMTGVDGITFSPNDSADPAHYSWTEVRKRRDGGISAGYSDFDRALVRLHAQLSDDAEESWNDIVGESGMNLYNRIVEAACSALADARRARGTPDRYGNPVLTAAGVNDFVLRALDRAGLVCAREQYVPELKRRALTVGAMCIGVDEYDAFFRNSETYRKLVDGGREEDELKREALAKPLMDLWREVREFVDANPYISDGDGRFFHNVSTPLPFIRGSGYFMYAANRRAHDSAKAVSESMNEYEKAFYDLCNAGEDIRASAAPDNATLLFRTLFHTREQSAQAVREAIARGEYSDKGIRADSTVRDLALAIHTKLTGMVWDKAGDPVVRKLGGESSVARMLKFFDTYRGTNESTVTGGAGMTDEMMYRMTGMLPYNHQLGHAVQNAIDGVCNAFAFRASLFNMMTTPAADGRPVCYAKPSENAVEAGGLTDQLWGEIARWWAETNDIGNVYDPSKPGIENARRVYDKVYGTMKDGKIGGLSFGSLDRSEIDAPSIDALIARKGTPEEESKLADVASGYALGYAKHLMQSTRAMGASWQRALIHRAYSYSKSLSVSFSYFFPLATRFESPIGALGAVATLGGNFSPEFLRKHADSFRKLQSALSGKGWITKDFIGQKDIFQMLDSNDPYLSELYHWAGCLGVPLSDASVNPLDQSRGVLQEDLKKVVALARRTGGTKAAARVDQILKAVLVKGGDRAFTYHLNATKLAVVAQLCTRLQAEAAKAGVAFDPVRDLKRYSGYINAEVGGIDPLKYAWAHPAARNWLNSLFFSWEWTRGAWEAGGGQLLEQVLFGGHDMTREERRYMLGRWTRMFLEIMVGVPMLFQVASKAFGTLLVHGLDPDDEALDEAERVRRRRLIEMVRRGSWFTWNNESKIGFTGYNVTPLMAGIAARFPGFAEYARKHPLMYAAPTLAAAMSGKPWLMLGTLPVYTGRDAANVTGGRQYYQRYGKQGWEFFRWFDAPFQQFLSKMPMPVQRIAEGLFGRSLTYMDHPQPYNEMGDVERWISPTADSAWFNLARAFVPFSITSLLDTSDAGALSVLGPVSMGASKGNITKRIQSSINAWASNDRKGYAFGGPVAHRQGEFKKWASRNLVTVNQLVREAMDNGFSEKAAFGLIDTAVRNLTGGAYDQIIRSMPLEPDQRFDEAAVGKALRKANRLGMLRKNIYRTLQKRLEEQNRWGEVREEERDRIREILRIAREDPYDVTNEKVNERFDY